MEELNALSRRHICKHVAKNKADGIQEVAFPRPVASHLTGKERRRKEKKAIKID